MQDNFFSTRLTYAHEQTSKIAVGFVGCGGQAFRNLLPAFRFASADLRAVCDVDAGRAAEFARMFGAERAYTDYREMLHKEQLDAVFFAVGYDEEGRPLYPTCAVEALTSGCHVWIEKPPASTIEDILKMQEAARIADRQVGVGFMKMFAPAIRKICSIVQNKDFGPVGTFYLRDPEMLPRIEDRHNPRVMRYFLDHIVHPASVIQRVLGPVSRLFVDQDSGGGSVASLKLVSGACGTLHMPWGQSSNSPKERFEVVGKGANIVLENNIRLTYYRPGHPGLGDFEYGRCGDYLSIDEQAPLHWEMDAYSGQPYNMHIFYQGYADEIRYFCDCIRTGRTVEIGGLIDALAIQRLVDAFYRVIPGVPLNIEQPTK